MSPNRRPTNRAILPLVLLASSIPAGIAVRRRRRVTETTQVSAEVTVDRDAYGAPHIVATSREDALFGLGYAVAADRLWQMDLARRSAYGEVAEIAGADALPMDRLMRLLNVRRSVQANAAAMDAPSRRAVEAFCAGVNQRMRRRPLPVEFRLARYRPAPWTVEDCLAVGALLAWMMGGMPYSDLAAEQLRAALGDEWADVILMGGRGSAVPVVREPAQPAVAAPRTSPAVWVSDTPGMSNAWVVSGERSVTGAPILASDPHLQYMVPSIWYEASIEAPDFTVAGVTIPGLPLIGIGRTPTFAWAFTAAMVSQTFLYRETLSDDGSAVKDGDGWTPLTTRTETIRVKGGPPEQLTVRETPRGPLFSDLEPDWCPCPLSLHWTGMEVSRDITAYLMLNAASTVDDALAAAELAATPPFNMAAADSGGNIATIGFGRFAPRAERPGLHEPDEFPPRYLPKHEMPVERNPTRGWTASANGRIVAPGQEPTLRGLWEPRFRIQRIADVLESRRRHSPAEMQVLQLDQYSLHAEEMTPHLLANLGDRAPGWALDDLRNWDFRAAAESRATLLFQAFYNHWVFAVLAVRLPEQLIDRMTTRVSGEAQFAFYDRLLKGELDAWFGGEDARREAVVATFDAALRWLEGRLGADTARWTWGALHRVTFTHPFGTLPGPHGRAVNSGPFPLGGDRSTLWMSVWDLRKPFDVHAGPSMRFVSDLRPGGRNWITNTLGSSGRPLSRHYRDQVGDFIAGRWHGFPAAGRHRWMTVRPATPPS